MLNLYRKINGLWPEFENVPEYPIHGLKNLLPKFQLTFTNSLYYTVSYLHLIDSKGNITNIATTNVKKISNNFRYLGTGISDLTNGLYYFEIKFVNGYYEEYFRSHKFTVFQTEINEIDNILIQNSSEIQFYPITSEISIQKTQDLNTFGKAIYIDYKQIKQFKLEYLTENAPDYIASLKICKLKTVNSVLSRFDASDFLIEEEISLDETAFFKIEYDYRVEFRYPVQNIVDNFLLPGVYVFKTSDSNGFEAISETLIPIYPRCELMSHTEPTNSISSTISGATVEITYKCNNIYSLCQFQMWDGMNWTNIGEPAKTFALTGNTVTLPYSDIYTAIRYINYLPCCNLYTTISYLLLVGNILIYDNAGDILSYKTNENILTF